MNILTIIIVYVFSQSLAEVNFDNEKFNGYETSKNQTRGHFRFVADSNWYEPDKTANEEHTDAFEQIPILHFGSNGHPLFFNDYPEVLTETSEKRSSNQDGSEPPTTLPQQQNPNDKGRAWEREFKSPEQLQTSSSQIPQHLRIKDMDNVVKTFEHTAADEPLNNKTFSKDFMFGCGTAAYQIEGGYKEDGKGETNWDIFGQRVPSPIKNGDNANIACDSYHKYKEDVAILADVGVTHYRFSIAWTRILPNGFRDSLNELGVNYYKNLISELKKYNIKPVITLLHYDTPEAIEALGGWTNPDFVEWFADYARICFQLFGDDVKHWLTFNEARVVCTAGYGYGLNAPGVHSPGILEYVCIHNVIKAHAAIWHVYNDEFRATQQGKLGIVSDTDWFEPENNTQANLDASEKMLLFQYGTYIHPLFFGDYPDIVKNTIRTRSLAQGYNSSRLPDFTEKEKEKIKGTIDFLGLNHYTSFMVRPAAPNPDGKGLVVDSEVEMFQPDDWERSGSERLAVVPWGAYKLLKWISNTYGNPPVLITENGYPDGNGTLNDAPRINYLEKYLSNFKDAIDSGVNIIGYTIWSIRDNFEWTLGYTLKYGLYYVDFDSPNRTRIPKQSVMWYKNVIQTRCLVPKCIDQ